MGVDNVTPISPHLASLKAPELLRSLPGWLMWRFEHTAGVDKKPRKVPYYASGGRRVGTQGTPEDRRRLTSFESARAAAARQGFDGVGIALLPGFGVSALDFDNCIANGIDPLVESLTAGTYTEFSPSGNGIRAFVQGELGDNKDSHPDDGAFGVEVFSHKGFVTFTGNMTEATLLTGSENVIAEPCADLQPFLNSRFTSRTRSAEPYAGSDKPIRGLTEPELVQLLDSLPDQLDYDTWIKVGMAVHHETQGDGYGLWDAWSSRSPKYSSAEYSNERWVSFGHNVSAEPSTITFVVRLAQSLGIDSGIDIDTAQVSEFELLDPLPSAPSGHHGLFTLGAFAAQSKHINWLIKGFLPRAQLGVLFGASGSGKSFLAFDICAALAQGRNTWNGRRVTKARTLYVVAEGVAGFRQRVHAYCTEHDIQPDEMDMVIAAGQVPNLTDAVSVRKLTEDIKQFGPFDLIVMDTFAQVTAGANENSGEDMGTALAHCRRINHVSGAMVLLIHHSGKDDSKGARGHSSIKAASDVELEVKRNEDLRSVSVTKLKDGADGFDQGFQLRTVIMGQDDDGDDITSCVVEYTGSGRVNPPKGKNGPNQKVVFEALNDLVGFDSESPVPYATWFELAKDKLPRGENTKDPRPRQFRLALKALLDAKLVEKCELNGGDCYVLAEKDM